MADTISLVEETDVLGIHHLENVEDRNPYMSFFEASIHDTIHGLIAVRIKDGFAVCMTSTTKYPVTFQRDTPTVRNITRTSAVLLVDLRDPPTQEVSIGYRLRCEETPSQRLAVNIDIEKKDASWGNGTARFTLTGLSPGRVYKCQASSRTDFGIGWTDGFSFMTVPKEVRKRPLSQFTWHHAVGLGSLGMLILLGVSVAQNRNG